MTLESVFKLDRSKFDGSSIPPQTLSFNERLMDSTAKNPNLFFDVDAARFRQMIHEGQTSIPKPVLLARAETFHIPSRDDNRHISCRILRPQSGVAINGVFMHLHLGGWVIGDEKCQDPVLQKIADANNLLCLSVGYRRASEDPFPAAPNDCFDVAEWLVDNAKSTFGADLAFVGGESAGAHLSVLVAVHLLRSPTYAGFKLRGLLLHFGVYDLSGLPQFYNFNPSRPLLIEREGMQAQISAFCPGLSANELKNPGISPLYADLGGLELPPALFTVGTQDLLLDDTLFMGLKWLTAGGEAIVKVYPGASHAYLGFPEHLYPGTRDVFEDIRLFCAAK